MIWDSNWSANEIDMPSDIQANCIIVYDITGRKLLQSNIINENDDMITLKNKLQHGCYLIQLLDGNRMLSNKKMLVY